MAHTPDTPDAPEPPRLIIPALGPLYDRLAIFAYPMVRFITGALLVPHGGAKLFGWFGVDIAGTAAFFAKLGLVPALPLAYYIGVLEFFGGIMIAVGLLTRFWAIQVVGFMAVAAFYVHWDNGFLWIQGGFEYPLMWGVVALAVFIEGGGPLSLDRAIGREL